MRNYGIFRTHIASITVKRSLIYGPCLVLGSGPNPAIPAGFNKTWSLLTVNASQASIKDLNMQPAVTVISDQMLGNSAANIAGKEALKNSKTSRLVLINRRYAVSHAKRILRTLNYCYEELSVISHWGRSRIAYEVLKEYVALGSGEQKISTGIFASLLALYAGANQVVLSGFSFSIDGHAYNTLNHKRSHISSDKTALLLARNKGLPFYTPDKTFSAESGLPEWKGL